jgi:hypothetical protein
MELQLSNNRLDQIEPKLKSAINDAIEEGHISPIKAWVTLNQMQKAIAALISDSILRDRVYMLTDTNVQEIENFEVKKSTGGPMLDYAADHKYVELEFLLKERKELLDASFKTKETLFDGEGVEIPKVPIKSYRKDSITVTKSRK